MVTYSEDTLRITGYLAEQGGLVGPVLGDAGHGMSVPQAGFGHPPAIRVHACNADKGLQRWRRGPFRRGPRWD